MTAFFEPAAIEGLSEVRMHERLAVALAREIVSGRLAEGATFPTSDALTATHGVSRTVSREALQALAAAGLIRIQHGKRTIVNQVAEWRFLDVLVQRAMQEEELPEKLVRDLYEARGCIETATARLCARRRSDETVQELEGILGKMSASLSDGEVTPAVLSRGVALDRAFHGAIGDGSGNVVLARAVRDTHRGLVASWHLSTLDPARLQLILEQHAGIVKAIRRRSGSGAAEAMRQHIEWSLEDALGPRARPGRRR
jgi:GntR family transcriptional regulator, transcriptional repressor for pyruvate dehydrogenase complex